MCFNISKIVWNKQFLTGKKYRILTLDAKMSILNDLNNINITMNNYLPHFSFFNKKKQKGN